MLSFADRIVKTVFDLTLGTVIVLVHVALAEREREMRMPVPVTHVDGTRVWPTQISP